MSNVVHMKPVERDGPEFKDGDDDPPGDAVRACMDCQFRIGRNAEPHKWMCGVSGYSVRRERFEFALYGDDPEFTCGSDAQFWQQRVGPESDVEIVEEKKWWRFLGRS